jgi:hypothetical protein
MRVERVVCDICGKDCACEGDKNTISFNIDYKKELSYRHYYKRFNDRKIDICDQCFGKLFGYITDMMYNNNTLSRFTVNE